MEITKKELMKSIKILTFNPYFNPYFLVSCVCFSDGGFDIGWMIWKRPTTQAPNHIIG